ncbi:MAG: hypothetical protein M1819_002882 [Sarea resinae]|nr:MAG: hypothetical protein M1819_002882 [Sarea resinae]
MRSASQVFYLAVFALLGYTHADANGATSSKGAAAGANTCALNPKEIISDACASYSTLDDLNTALKPSVKAITQTTDFFSYYRLNLYSRACPFWSDDDAMCGSFACAVVTIDNEEDIPLVWRAEELSKLEGPKAVHPGRRQQEERKNRPLQGELGEDVGESCVVEYDDECDERDYCVLDDESTSGKGDYVSLQDNPERFTGYAGPSANQLWSAIYRENCFYKDPAKGSVDETTDFSPFQGQPLFQASNDLRSVMKEHGRQQALTAQDRANMNDGLEFDDECLEKRVFYRVISGMHASISSHLCWEHLNQSTGEWGPNLKCYEERLHKHPERLTNLYFNYAMVLRAIEKLRPTLREYTFCSGDPTQDRETKQKVLRLADKVASAPKIFDEGLMFQDSSVGTLKEDFRNKFRNVSRLMDCVGCDKCRLWGKVQTNGYGTALKVLFEFDEQHPENNPPLRRTELVALMNTLDRISHSISSVGVFRQMIAARDAGHPMTDAEKKQLAEEADRAVTDAYDDEDYEEPLPEESFKELFVDEWYRIWRTAAFVITSWIKFPGTAFGILLNELQRLWDFWLGLPVRPRTWELHFPTHDEI